MEKEKNLNYVKIVSIMASLLFLVVGLISMLLAQIFQATVIMGLGIWYLMASVIILKNYDFARNRLLLLEIKEKMEKTKK